MGVWIEWFLVVVFDARVRCAPHVSFAFWVCRIHARAEESRTRCQAHLCVFPNASAVVRSSSFAFSGVQRDSEHPHASSPIPRGQHQRSHSRCKHRPHRVARTPLLLRFLRSDASLVVGFLPTRARLLLPTWEYLLHLGILRLDPLGMGWKGRVRWR